MFNLLCVGRIPAGLLTGQVRTIDRQSGFCRQSKP
jgi:hypothetical protein